MAESAPGQWTLPARPTATTDTFYTNTLPGGANLPYGSLGAQLLDAFRISGTLPGHVGFVNNRYNNITGGTPGGGGNPGGGYQPPGGGGYQPPTQPPTQPPLPPQITHGNNPAGTGNNQWGPYAPPASGIGNWQTAVNKVLGAGDPVKLIQQAIMAHPHVTKTGFGTNTTYDPATLNTLRTQFAGAGMDPYAAAKIAEAFGAGGQDAYSAAGQLGLLGQYTAGGPINGLRPAGTWSK